MLQAVQKIILAKQKILMTSFENLKRHLTGEEKILIPSFKILMLSFGILVSSFLIINNTYADESSNLDYAITVEPSLNVTTSATDISLNLNPANHPFDTKDLAVSVGTNNETGYKLILSTIDNTTNLVEQNDNNLYIETLSSETDQANFPGNRWGYKLNSISENYVPFTSNVLISSSDKPTPTIITNTLSFAAKANYNTKAGTYNLALNFQATANPHYKTIADAEYMQEVDSKEIGGCPSDLAVGQPYTLKDSRDDQEYVVSKLADGNCWMMTNLNLGAKDLQVTQLDSSNTNISSTIVASTFASWKKSSGTATYTSPEYIPVSGNDSYNNLPYGTLYNYCATSGNDSRLCVTSLTSQPSPMYDICPAGWRLPTGGTSGEFQALYGQSAYNSLAKMRSSYTSGGAAFVFAGYFGDATPKSLGSFGSYWGSTRYHDTDMDRLYIDGSGVHPDYGYARRQGSSIRCILK